MNADWLIWQLADSAFPAGGFGHSGGLEAAMHHGELNSRAALAGFLECSLSQAGSAALPLMKAAFDEPDRFAELDRLSDTWITNHVANRASRLQGRAFWTAAARAFPIDARRAPASAPTPAPFPSSAPDPGHWAPVFGIVTRRLGVAIDTARRLFLFLHLRGLVSAAVRLGLVGPLEGQRLQHALAPLAEATSKRCAFLGLDDLAQTAPLLDLWQGAHDRLYSRLFQS